jgi:hypothetical protein
MLRVHIRPYDDTDAPSWLRCRLLSFFATQYYDDVVTQRPTYDQPSIQLVAAVGGEIVGASRPSATRSANPGRVDT